MPATGASYLPANTFQCSDIVSGPIATEAGMWMSWAYRNLVNPGLKALAGAVAIGAVTIGVNKVPAMATGCPATIEGRVMQGERALQSGAVNRAAAIADEALAEEPKAPCAHELAAAVHWTISRDALRKRRLELAEDNRKLCYSHAIRADSFLGESPRVKSLRQNCQV